MPTRPQPPTGPRRPVTPAAPPGGDGVAAGAAPVRGRRHAEASRSKDLAAPLALRLAIGRDGIGLELADPVDLACLRVVEMSTTLPGMRFPVDVSGGVTRFRHRRGDLQILRIEVAARALEKWMAPRLRGLVGTRVPDVWIEVGRARSTVCVAALADAEERAEGDARTRDTPIVAFDIEALAEGEDIVLVVTNARGAGLPQPASAMAIACADALLGPIAERTGAVFTLRRPATAVARALLPAAGARVPSTETVRWAALSADAGTWLLHASRSADPAAPTEEALRAREIAMLLAAGIC